MCLPSFRRLLHGLSVIGKSSFCVYLLHKDLKMTSLAMTLNSNLYAGALKNDRIVVSPINMYPYRNFMLHKTFTDS